MLAPTRVQLPAQLLQVQTPSRSGGHRSENYIHAGDAYFQKGQDDPPDQMYTLEHEASSTSHYHKENEGKMGPIPVPAPGNQFRPPLPDTNPNVRRNDVAEKRKRATPKKKFRPAIPKPTTVHPPLPEAPPKPKNSMPLPLVPVREDTPWPGTGKMSGNLLRTEIGYSLKTIWPLKTKVRT